MNEGQHGLVTYTNADVEVPILFTNRLAKNDNRISYDEHDGEILHKPIGKISKLFALYGVYFIWLHVDANLLTDPDLHQGFARLGTR